jgi:cytochrome c oxidase subunit 3
MWTLLAALVSALIVWALLVRFLTAMPWAAAGDPDYTQDIAAVDYPAKKVGLFFFLAVVTSLFALFVTAYVMRMDPHHGGDWHTITKPGVLWINTLLLILGSAAMQWAKAITDKPLPNHLGLALTLGGALTLVFLLGQLLAWQQLHGSEYFHLGNPALGFFYLLTGVHALHLLGGLYVWARTTVKVWRYVKIAEIKLNIELCTVYWHYLLLVWLVLFGLLLST